jgi:hypothetical protein
VKYKIMMVGVFDVKGSTNIEMAEGFRSLGHSVETYNYRTKITELGGPDQMEEDYLKLIQGRKFDLQIFCKVNQMHPAILHLAKESGPTWYWFMDNFEVCRQIHASAYAANATYASATASDVTLRFKDLNKNAHHIFEGYNPKLYYKEDLRKVHDYIFIGNATVPRIIALTDLKNEGLNISIFGSGWPIGMKTNAPVHGEDERIEINSSKVVLNLCHDSVIFSDRVTKALACGANVVSHSCVDIMEMVKGFIGNTIHMKDMLEKKTKWVAIVGDQPNMLAIPKGTSFRLNAQGFIEDTVRQSYSWESVASQLIEKGVEVESTVR